MPSSAELTVVVREMAAPDLNSAVELALRAWGALHDAPASARAFTDHPEVVERDLRQRLQRSVMLVAEQAGRVVGIVNYVPGPDDPYAEFEDRDGAGIRSLGVHPDAQRRGVAKAMVEECLRRARSENKARVVLHTTPWMPAAHRLYQSAGFRRAPERDFQPLPELILQGYELTLT